LLLLLCAVGAIYLWRGVGSTSVYTAARDLPAYHRIREQDVRRQDVRSSGLPDHAVTVRDAVVGHYTLGAVRQDDLFDSSKVGPVLNDQALDERHVIGLRGSLADVLNDQLAPGDRVDVLLSPRQRDAATRGVRLHDVLVLDVEEARDPRSFVIVVAVSATDEQAMLRAAGSTRALISRVSARGDR
jgi:Flp pilus assembly protein CpaB